MNTSFGNAVAVRTLALSGLLVLALVLTNYVLQPISTRLFPATEVNALLLYLPHGIRVLGAWLFGWKSVIYLLPGNVLTFFAMSNMAFDGLSTLLMFIVVLSSPPLAFQVLAFFGFDLRRNSALRFNWRSVVFAGGLASLINALSLHLIRFSAIPADEHLVGITYWVIGDMLGVVVVLVGMLAIDRWIRRTSE